MRVEKIFVKVIVLILFAYFIILLNVNHTIIPDGSFTTHKKEQQQKSILVSIASENMIDRIDVLESLFDTYIDFCEAGYKIDVVIDTYDTDIAVKEYLQYRSQVYGCSRSLKDFSITIEIHEKVPEQIDIPIMFIHHRTLFLKHLFSYNYFIFSENDVHISLSTFAKWKHETEILGDILSRQMHIGLVRYENSLILYRNPRRRKRIQQLKPSFSVKRTIGKGTSVAHSILPMSRITWEFPIDDILFINSTNFPNLDLPQGVNENAYFTVEQKEYFSAAQIFSRDQLSWLENDCQFLSNHSMMPLIRYAEFYSSIQPYHCKNVQVNVTEDSLDARESFSSIKEMSDLSSLQPVATKVIELNLNSSQFYCCRKFVLPVDQVGSLFVHHIGTPGDPNKFENKWSNKHRINNSYFSHQWMEKLNRLKQQHQQSH